MNGQNRYSVRYWYPAAKGWQDYFNTDHLQSAAAALDTGNPPEMMAGDYDYIMRRVRANNRRQIYDNELGKVMREIPRPGKLRRFLNFFIS